MTDRIEPVRRRTRGPAAVAGVARLHDDDWRRRREDDAAAAAPAPSSGAGRPAPGGITLDDDGHVHVDLSA